MSLAKSVETLIGRPLDQDELLRLANFQRNHEIHDDDPLIVVMGLVATSHLMMSSLPDLLQQKATETITLHQQTLREQSTLIAKELILSIAQNIESANRLKLDWRTRLLQFGVVFLGGAFSMFLFLHFWYLKG